MSTLLLLPVFEINYEEKQQQVGQSLLLWYHLGLRNQSSEISPCLKISEPHIVNLSLGTGFLEENNFFTF